MKKLTDEEIQAALTETDGWTLAENAIQRKVECDSFPEALLLINAVGHFAEKANHHPEIYNVYKWVTFTLSTHDAGGLTKKDFALAKKINRLL